MLKNCKWDWMGWMDGWTSEHTSAMIKTLSQADSFRMGEPAPLRGGARGAGERVDSPQLLLAQLGQPHAAGKRHRSQVSANFQM